MNILKPLGEVFEAIIDPKKMSQYFITTGSGRMVEGGVVIWKWDDFNGITQEVKIEKIEKNKRIVFQWNASGMKTSVEMRMVSISSDATTLKIYEDGWKSDEKGIACLAENTQGWVSFLCCLKAYLEYGINLRKGAY
jgi:uncharacterized protein YndB with AHSA1/START domain